MIRYLSLFLPALLVAGFFLEAAPRRYDDELTISLKEMRDTLDDLRREINNHESEIRTYEQRTDTQESSLEKIREELKETLKGQKELLKTNQGSLDGRLVTLENTTKGIVSDLKQIKTSANDSQEVLKTFKDKIQLLEKTVEAMNKNLEILQAATSAIVDSFKSSIGLSSVTETVGTARVYKVKAGDSLEKIARAHGTTIKVIKELNQLTRDQISIGQNLKLPE